MLRPSPNHGTLRLPNDDDYDGFDHCTKHGDAAKYYFKNCSCFALFVHRNYQRVTMILMIVLDTDLSRRLYLDIYGAVTLHAHVKH